MPVSNTAFVFPAFVRDYSDDTCRNIPGFPERFQCLLRQASELVDRDLAFFDPLEQNFLDHELRTQYLAYIYGCAVSEILQAHGIQPGYLAGYSMGIYAALAQGGSVPFESGLWLIRNAFQEISYTTLTGRFGMAGIIGLTVEEVQKILENFRDVEITNRNSAWSLVLSGKQKELEEVLQIAHSEGAFHARMLNVTVPYHSRLLKSAAIHFARFVYTLDIKALKVPLVSVISQNIIRHPEDIKTELVENLYMHFNWLMTQQKMLDMGVITFIECGPGKSLVKNAKFIPGNYSFVEPAKVISH